MKFVVTEMITTNESLTAKTHIPHVVTVSTKLFGFLAESVFIGPNFDGYQTRLVDWDIIADPLSHLIKEHMK